MSKILQATCVAGVVTAEGIPVPAADVLSEGVMASTGILVMDEDNATYVTSNASDIKTMIENLGSLLDQVIVVLTGLDAVTVSPGSMAAAIALLTTAKTTFVATKEVLK